MFSCVIWKSFFIPSMLFVYAKMLIQGHQVDVDKMSWNLREAQLSINGQKSEPSMGIQKIKMEWRTMT